MLENQKIEMPVLIQDLGIQFATETSNLKKRFGIYRCQCGAKFKARTDSVKSGNAKSCGCFKIAQKTTHGLATHRLYKTWRNMIQRTTNPKDIGFQNYGARGISVCDRWLNVVNFIEDMYPSFEEGLTIDRINNDGNYEPSNCRWATASTQNRNTRILMSRNTSGYRGVSFIKRDNVYFASVSISNKTIPLGTYEIASEAAKAYDTYIIENNLEHTRNFKEYK